MEGRDSDANPHRKITVNAKNPLPPPDHRGFAGNEVKTTKYTLFNFPLYFVRDQLKQYTNVFYILVVVVQQTPGAAYLGRYTMLIPLVFIILVSAVKEIWEDLRRFRRDRFVNKQKAWVLCRETFRLVNWQDVRVGQVVRVAVDEQFPADLLLLYVRDDDGGGGRGNSGGGGGGSDCDNEGVCYVETVNLDGESYLKARTAVLKDYPMTLEVKNQNLTGEVKCDLPNDAIYTFKGEMCVNRADGVVLRFQLNEENLLLRGTSLKNSPTVYGLVLYAGTDTKVMKNAKKTRSKTTKTSEIINGQIVCMAAIFMMFSISNWLLYMFKDEPSAYAWYLPDEISRDPFRSADQPNDTFSTAYQGLISFLIYCVIYSVVVPISLQVSAEISFYYQARQIECDPNMKKDGIGAQVRTSNLNADLGMVRFIFSDKTGTLTQNMLEFRKCSVRGGVYDTEALERMQTTVVGPHLENFFKSVCLCPGIIATVRSDDGNIEYHSPSPDHKTLVKAAAEYGYKLRSRNRRHCRIEVKGAVQTYEILAELEFSSDSKHSTVVVKNGDVIRVCAMGADEFILPRASKKYRNAAADIREFADAGLRVMCVANRKLDADAYDEFLGLLTRTGKTAAFASIEENLTLVGISAVEDKLQDQVPETIKNLLEADIKLWLLTGDKMETVKNVGQSTRLLCNDVPVVEIERVDDVVKTVASSQHLFHNNGRVDLIVTGECISSLEDDVARDILLNFATRCHSVICCRTSPKQKAQVVEAVSKYLNVLTLAIGDGANDVAMIQTAHIGVGISGVEGMQASNSADYSIAQFSHLKRLLLVHGSWNYDRVAKMIFFCHYKSIAMATIQFLFNFYCMWSGTLPFERWSRTMYNILYTSIATLYFGIEEKKYPDDILLRRPDLYKFNDSFNDRNFALSVLNAFVDSILIMLMTVGLARQSGVANADEASVFCTFAYTGLILMVNVKLLIYSNNWNAKIAAIFVGALASWACTIAILSFAWPWFDMGEDMVRTGYYIATNFTFYLYVIWVFVACNVTDVYVLSLPREFKRKFYKFLRRHFHNFFPSVLGKK